jgi:hypothetical protein
MALQITINSLNGTPNYDVYVCDSTGGSCIYLATIDGTLTPYTFNAPPPLDNQTEGVVKIIVANDCVITGTT